MQNETRFGGLDARIVSVDVHFSAWKLVASNNHRFVGRVYICSVPSCFASLQSTDDHLLN